MTNVRLSQLSVSPVSIQNEKPKARPPKKAAGLQRTHRRSSTYIASAEAAGAIVSATLSVNTGPSSIVSGASGTPKARTEVSSKILKPVGGNSRVDQNNPWPWLTAQAGHDMNQR